MTERAFDLFVEDRAHEAFLSALIDRIAAEERLEPNLHIRSGRGGHGRALAELRIFQQAVVKGGAILPDIVVVAIDANCQSFNRARHEIGDRIEPELQDRVVIACPDPHIERWYMADPPSFKDVVGRQPRLEKVKCERDRYKQILVETIHASGQVTTLGGIELAGDLVAAMDLYRAGKSEPSLKSFVDDLRRALRTS
jgi:hypothetical protein